MNPQTRSREAKHDISKRIQRFLQQNGCNRFDARRTIYGPTWKQSTVRGRGVNLVKPKDPELEVTV